MLDAIMREDGIDSTDIVDAEHTAPLVDAKKVLLVDHEDSFVHTLANYIRQTGVEVVTCRSGEPLKLFLEEHDKSSDKIDLVLLSPGPGNPSDFKLKDTISAMIERKIPIFGVCLGLQGLVEYYGGTLDILSYPMHGKPSIIKRVGEHTADDILNGLPDEFGVARYHSLYGRNDNFPQDLKVTAVTSDGVVMAVQHRTLPIAAVQFHPESILTLPKHGMKIIRNVLQNLKKEGYP